MFFSSKVRADSLHQRLLVSLLARWALALLDECEMNKAREKALSAKTCLEWSGDTTGSISDILAVVKLAEHRMKGDDRLNEAENIYRCVMGVIWGYYL